MLAKGEKSAFDRFYRQALKNKVLDDKTTLLVHYATALAYGCRACIEHYIRMVKEGEGLTEEELGAVQAIVMAQVAGRIQARFKEMQKR